MLCDDIQRDRFRGVASDTSGVRRKINDAVKFVLAPNFAAVADALSANYNNLSKALEFCRLPAPLMWIEVAHTERPSFVNAPTHAPEFQHTPARVGFLCEALNTDCSVWKAHICWSFRHGGTSIAQVASVFDMKTQIDMPAARERVHDMDGKDQRAAGDFVLKVHEPHPGWASATEDVKAILNERINRAVPDFEIEAAPPGFSTTKWVNVILDMGRADWAGEAAYLLACIALLNSPNAHERIEVDHTRYNSIRAKKGKQPLASHHVVRIHPLQTKRVRESTDTASQHRELRHHFVMGHWKVRKTGIYFWRFHMRGSGAGKVSKEYSVE